MTEPEASSNTNDVPGRLALRDLAVQLRKIPARELATGVHAPYLLQLGDVDEKPMGKSTTAFKTVSPELAPAEVTGSKPARFAYAIAKRAGGNAFAHMVTLGRAKNNDLVVPDGAVSKFHASFTQAPGGWAITDASSNGTWVDGKRLQQGRASLLRSGATIAFAQQVRFLYLTATDLMAFLGTGRL